MRILKPTFVRRDKRGTFVEILNDKNLKNISYGTMKKGAVMGNHYHKKTKVIFFLTSGAAKVNILKVTTGKTETINLSQKEGIEFLPGYSHAIYFLKDSSFIMGKSQAYSLSDPDTYRLVVPDKLAVPEVH